MQQQNEVDVPNQLPSSPDAKSHHGGIMRVGDACEAGGVEPLQNNSQAADEATED